MLSEYQKQLALIRTGDLPKTTGPKEKKPLRRQSPAKIAELAKEKEERGNEDTQKEKWFQARRKEMVGTCQCGCTKKSSKYDNDNFRSSCAHIFPQRLFPSIQYHKLNFVERAFWATERGSSCHTNMDNGSMDKWPMYADWDDIKEKFHQLVPLLTDEERATKFYTHLEKLVYSPV
jgi:hypothetical protein